MCSGVCGNGKEEKDVSGSSSYSCLRANHSNRVLMQNTLPLTRRALTRKFGLQAAPTSLCAPVQNDRCHEDKASARCICATPSLPACWYRPSIPLVARHDLTHRLVAAKMERTVPRSEFLTIQRATRSDSDVLSQAPSPVPAFFSHSNLLQSNSTPNKRLLQPPARHLTKGTQASNELRQIELHLQRRKASQAVMRPF